MRYITAEQFKEQPREVQKVFIDWWEPSPHDLVFNEALGIWIVKRQDMLSITRNSLGYGNIPLFTLQQLWEFIEDEMDSDLNISYVNDGYILEVGVRFSIVHQDKLQAFWKCACEVARVIK